MSRLKRDEQRIHCDGYNIYVSIIMCVSSGKRKRKWRGAFLEFLIGYNINMARRRRKKKNENLTISRPVEAVRDDYSQRTANDQLKDTPFAGLKTILRQAGYSRPDTEKKYFKPSDLCAPDSTLSSVRTDVLQAGRAGENSKTVDIQTGSCPGLIEHKDRCEPCDLQPEDDSRLFLQAMDGVRPLARKVLDPSQDIRKGSVADNISAENEVAACTQELEAIVRGEKDIPVEHTPEYVEGPVINSNPRIVRKLRRGKFSVQAYCDLHGLTANEALEWCEEFMARSIAANRSCIAIIHGRGLSSPRGPVLKQMVQEWLTKGKWRRHVIAYSSAPNWDGGSGVTYVLLRQRPAPRKKRRKLRLWSE